VAGDAAGGDSAGGAGHSRTKDGRSALTLIADLATL
jgi:hypothetical protein